MKIAQVAPLVESVPPKNYGGTERVVSCLTDTLVEMGHEVTLFASGDSETKAKLIAPTHTALRSNKEAIDYYPHYIYMLELVQQMAPDFDIIHYHIDYMHFPLSRRNRTNHCTTMHGRLDLADTSAIFREFMEMPLISISDRQRHPLPYANFVKTVYHGLPPDSLAFNDKPEDYLAFVGRISPEKGPDKAIEIAKQTGRRLKIAAKIDNKDLNYYEDHIKKLMDHPLIEFVGEVDMHQKNELLRNAAALLFPIDWPEPFGLVMIESMACGAPVIAFDCGSVPEIIEEGISGFIVDDFQEAIDRVNKIDTINRASCRAQFEKRFTCERMAQDYMEAYQELVDQREDLQKVIPL